MISRVTGGVLLLLALSISPARATTGSIEMVWQPIWLADADGPVMSAVTYLSDYESGHDFAIRASVLPGAVWSDGKPAIANAAAAYGLRIDVQEFRGTHTPDTLRVVLHVPTDDDMTKRAWKPRAREIVASTAQCILINALSIIPNPPRFIDLKILGSSKWKYLDGVHSLKNVHVPPRPFMLNNGALQK